MPLTHPAGFSPHFALAHQPLLASPSTSPWLLASPSPLNGSWHNPAFDRMLCRPSSGGSWAVFDASYYLSWCFLDRYLTVLPNVVFVLALASSCCSLMARPAHKPVRKWDFYAKSLVLALHMLFLVLFEMRLYSVSGSPLDPALVPFTLESAALSVIALGLAIVVHYQESSRALPVGCDSLHWYWLVNCITNFMKMFAVSDLVGRVLQTFLCLGSVLMLLLEWLLPQRRVVSSKASMLTASAFSRAIAGWIGPFIAYSNANDLGERDMPDLEEGFNVHDLTAKLESSWTRTAQSSWLSLARALMRTFRPQLLVITLSDCVMCVCFYVQPFLLRWLIAFVASYPGSPDSPRSVRVGVWIALLILLQMLVRMLAENISSTNGIRIFTGLNGSIYGILYRKAIRLSPQARQDHPPSQIMNFMTVDLGKIASFSLYLSRLVSFPLLLVLCLTALYQFLGPNFMAGLLAILVAVPINGYVSSKMTDIQTSAMTAKDDRVKYTTNLFSNAKSLKLYGWENSFLARLLHIRNNIEFKYTKSMRRYHLLLFVMWNLQPYLVATLVFGFFLLFTDTPLTADIVFPCLVLFKSLSEILTAIPFAVVAIIQARVSLKRVVELLIAGEDDLSHVFADPDHPVSQYGAHTVQLNNVSVNWTEHADSAVALENLNYHAKKGELSCIVGKVGAGKTALLKTICGRLCVRAGLVNVNGHVAYVPQEPWLINRTVKENILFETKFDPEFYHRTLEACCLLQDIDQWPDGDETEIGEKGVSLSGGQKARVSLARAVYSRSDIYVMDDVLSAVDEHVAAHLIKNLLDSTGLLASKTIILATNNIKILHRASNIVMLQNKKIVEHGSYSQVMDHGGDLAKLIREYGKEETSVSEQSSQISFELKRRSSSSTLRRASDASLKSVSDEVTKALRKTRQEEEKNAVGGVHKNVFARYLKAGGYTTLVWIFAFLVGTALCTAFSSIWLKIWTDSGNVTRDSHAMYYLLVYFSVGLVFTFLFWLKDYLHTVVFAVRASELLHSQMAAAVLRAPMSFFETTPLGRILNRFTADLNEIDELFMYVTSTAGELAVNLVSGLAIIVYATPYVVLAMLPLTLLYVYYQRLYINTSRQTKRITMSTKSPILAHLDESLKGLDILHAFAKTGRFVHLGELHAEMQLKALFASQMVDRWLEMRLGFIGAFIGFMAAITAVYMASTGHMTAGLVGLVMANAFGLTSFMTDIVKQSVFIEKSGVALERICQFIDLPSEAPQYVDGNRPPAYWPNHGVVNFDHYSVRYRDNLDLVLKDINIHINPHEKIGVVGRTGAGKSTLTLALFRIVEPAAGHIEIDSINASQIGLDDLRQNMSIIPQDAQVFAGTVRDNLDPLTMHTDEKLIHTLKLCHLHDHVQSLGGLDAELKDGGSNLSKGQCQLICLARALLHHSKILVLDEATASVDVETDKIIQETIRSEFKHKTIITVAHRLNTILDSDRIVVLDNGEVAEFDTPQNLLANKQSQFYSLCEQGGFV